MTDEKKTLDLATNDLNAAIQEFEMALIGLKLGVRAQMMMALDETLVFGKYDMRWRLLWQRKDEDPIPLVNAPREVRIRAVEFFEHFPGQMLSAADRELQRVLEATEKARAFSAILKGN